MKPNYTRIVVIGVIVLAAGFWLVRAAKPVVKVDSGYHLVMGTFSRIVVLARDPVQAQACLDAAFAVQNQIDQTMSTYKPDSELSRVNREAYDHPVAVGDPTWTVLQKAREVGALSGGAFDVTVGPEGDLWKAAGEANELPSAAALAQARAKVGWSKLLLDPREKTVRFSVPGMKIDLGGIAKGYAIDQSVAALQSHGALGAMVDIGGDIRCFGRVPPGQTTWKIGIQDPKHLDTSAEQQVLLTLNILDKAVATSGHYRRFALIDGQRVSHIIDPQQGTGSDRLASVTILANEAMTADALATAVSVMGREKGLALIESLPDTEAVILSRDASRQWQTSGAEQYLAVGSLK